MHGLTRRRILLLFLLATGLAGCTDEDTDRLSGVGHKIAQKAEAAVGNADGKLFGGLQGFGANAEQSSIAARVSARLRWDKVLTGVSIAVSESGTTVQLKGTVKETAQKERALELAQSTEGVEKVDDNIEVAAKEPAKDE